MQVELGQVRERWRDELQLRRQQLLQDVLGGATCSGVVDVIKSRLTPQHTPARHHLPAMSEATFDVKTAHPRLHTAICQLIGGEVSLSLVQAAHPPRC